MTWEKGQSGNPAGREPGTLTAQRMARMAMQAVDNMGGVDYFAKQARKNPAAFLGFLKALLPKDIRLSGDIRVSWEEWLRRVGRPGAGPGPAPETEPDSGTEPSPAAQDSRTEGQAEP